MEPVFSITKNESGKELSKQGSDLFPCAAYDRDIRQYIAGEIPPHWHPEMELFLLTEGSARISFSDSEYDLRKGEGFFANSGALHGVASPDGCICRYRSMVFDPAILSGSPGSAFDLLYLRPFMEQGPASGIYRPGDDAQGAAVIRLFQSAFEACQSREDGYEFTVRHALSQIFLIFRKQASGLPRRKNDSQELRMKQMLTWLDQHYAEEVTVSQLAASAGICVRECQRVFSSMLHTSPVQYLNRRRVTAAAQLLVSGDTPVSEIGLCCGFGNPSYFAKQFRDITGLTPREYRKKYASMDNLPPLGAHFS